MCSIEASPEMTALSFAYHAHGTANSAVIHGLCAMTNQQCMVAQAQINHPTSYIYVPIEAVTS